MDLLLIAYLAVLVLGALAVTRWAPARIPAALVSLGIACYFGWQTWRMWHGLQSPPASPDQGMASAVGLAMNAVGLVFHLLVAVALTIEVAIGRRSRRRRRRPDDPPTDA